LSVYAIPPELLAALTVRSIQAQDEPTAEVTATIEPVPADPIPASSSGLGCQACPGASFETPEDQRAHFKSDWHRYNAKARLQGKPVTADEWEGMVEGE
jgi:hypothetical protein